MINENILPLVSVIVPAYNAEKTIAECIKSLIDQTYPKERCEIIIVDNGSGDKTQAISKKYPVKYFVEDKIRSSYAARNFGVRAAKGEILAFTDADCIADKDWLKNGVAVFTDEGIGCVAGGIRSCEPQNYIEEYLGGRDILVQEDKIADMPQPYAKTANAFYRKKVFDMVGFFEEKWVSGGDADLSWRMQFETGYKVSFAPGAAVLHRHRSTLRALFMQCMTWGVGSTLLYKKYSKQMPKRTRRQTIWILWRIIYLSIALVPFYAADKEKMDPAKRKKCLDRLTFLGWERGRVVGSIRNGVFYI